MQNILYLFRGLCKCRAEPQDSKTLQAFPQRSLQYLHTLISGGATKLVTQSVKTSLLPLQNCGKWKVESININKNHTLQLER